MKNDIQLAFGSLGGIGEIGLNCYLYSISEGEETEYFVVDLGMGFNSLKSYPFDTYYPDVSFLAENKDKVKGIIITHGHEDHIGAIPYVWEYIKAPIYTTAWTADLIYSKLKEHNLHTVVPIHVVERDNPYLIGKIKFTWMEVNHSIPDCSMILMETPKGNMVHSGDFKVNYKNKEVLTNLESLQAKEIEYLFCDSTNVFDDGLSGNEDTVKPDLSKLIAKSQGATWITLFASNVERIGVVLDIAKTLKKKVVLLGRSLHNYTEISFKHKVIDDKCIIPETEIPNYPRHELIFIATGSQGEERSFLANVVKQRHSKHPLKEHDIVIFSSKIIPGNEKKIGYLHNLLAEQEITYYTEKDYHIHVSGHPKKEDLREIYNLIKPKWIVPIHGETVHIKAHSNFAYENGYATLNCEIGDLVSLFDKEPYILGNIHTGKMFYEFGRVFSMKEPFVKERSNIFYDGSVFITAYKNGNTFAEPLVDIIGLLKDEEMDFYCKKLASFLHVYLNETFSAKIVGEEAKITTELKLQTRKFCKNAFSKKPVVKVHILT